MSWDISFISKEDFKEHIRNTIRQYGDKLQPYDIEKFNSNIIDPIKMVFDKAVYGRSWEELISAEIFRQRDKSNTNDIGYFHQRIFQYIDGCYVPKNGEEGGWDVIVDIPEGYVIAPGIIVHEIYVEMKNKHNTMNSASSAKTYMKMQNQLLHNDDCACFLVEAIAARSQNITWKTTVDRQKVSHRCIRRVSMDCFYELVTGEYDAFYKICIELPFVVQEVINEEHDLIIPRDIVYDQLKTRSRTYLYDEDFSFLLSMYMLGFSTYNSFERFED